MLFGQNLSGSFIFFTGEKENYQYIPAQKFLKINFIFTFILFSSQI